MSRRKGIFYLTSCRSEPASSPGQSSSASLPRSAGPAAREPGSGPSLPTGHCFKKAQCLLNQASTSRILLAVCCYPDVNNDCHTLFHNYSLKSSFLPIRLFLFVWFCFFWLRWVFVAVRGLLIAVASRCGARALGMQALVVVARGLQ